jgi:hypothetical protein
MPRMPRLIHPIPVYLRKIDRDQTAVQDENLSEPIGQVRHDQKPTRLVAQIKRERSQRPVASEGGVIEESDGYMTFRTHDLRVARVTIERGDRVVQIGDAPNDSVVDYYFQRSMELGHYPFARGNTLIRWYFEDRQPSRQR